VLRLVEQHIIVHANVHVNLLQFATLNSFTVLPTIVVLNFALSAMECASAQTARMKISVVSYIIWVFVKLIKK
jgi:hypothetical protein